MASRSRRQLAADAWGALLQTHAALVPSSTGPCGRTPDSRWPGTTSSSSSRQPTTAACACRAAPARGPPGARISQVVDELVLAGLVTKEPNPVDARSWYALITTEGRQRFEASAPHYLGQIEQRFAAGLTDDELRTIARALRRVQTPSITPRPTTR